MQGYSANLTETVEETKPSLINSVQVKRATAADCHYVEEAIRNTERVTGQTVENLYADGAYQSAANREFAKRHINENGESLKMMSGKIQGGVRFMFKPIEGSADITVIDTSDGVFYRGVFINKTERRGRRWRIKLGDRDWRNNPFRYFYEKDFVASQLRQEIENLPIEKRHKRNNVEATMFQYSFHTRNNKTRYRGLFKHGLQAKRRSAWINFRRLVLYIVRTCLFNILVCLKIYLRRLLKLICDEKSQLKLFFDFSSDSVVMNF